MPLIKSAILDWYNYAIIDSTNIIINNQILLCKAKGTKYAMYNG